ncbi:MAG: hypothetical protein GF411_16090 [Candidatus Lokiarchaeota archaeon]|nr:hypothetical protein [Candidatus Lokiarchaeota archaeon]
MDNPSIIFDVEYAPLSIGVLALDAVSVSKSTSEFEVYEQQVFQEIRNRTTLDELRDDEIFRSYRDLYWTHGMDPTKLRVSSEALVRRIVNGHNLWRVSNLVDTANLASAYHSLPVGLIDTSSLSGDLQVRIARKDEVFERIGGKKITCRGREIVLADDEKIVCFGFATHDSHPTRVTMDSTNVLLLIYGAPLVSREQMNSAMKITQDMINKWIDCTISSSDVFTTE